MVKNTAVPVPTGKKPGKKPAIPPTGKSLIASNKKARHDYEIMDIYEAGISLTGTEVKSLRAGRASLIDGYATISEDEVWLRGVHIAEYAEGSWTNHVPRRARKLLLHRLEITKLANKLREASGGIALIPLQLYFLDGKVKVQIALARGKKEYDKRHTLAARDADRELERYSGRRAKGMAIRSE